MAKKKNGVNPLLAAVTGVVVGAGAAVVGVVTLKDNKNLKSVTGVVSNLVSKSGELSGLIKKDVKKSKSKKK